MIEAAVGLFLILFVFALWAFVVVGKWFYRRRPPQRDAGDQSLMAMLLTENPVAETRIGAKESASRAE